MEIEYLELFNKMRKISSEEFLEEKNKIRFFNVNDFTNDQAFMNWRMDGNLYEQFICMYEGYAEVSLSLIKDCMENRISNKKDIWIFPIFFNIIHSLELFLKATNYILINIENNFEKEIDITEGGHNIMNISKKVYEKIDNSNEFRQFKSDFEVINQFIILIADIFKIETVDKDTFVAPRYPITKNNIPYKYANPDSQTIYFKVKMSNLYIWLLKIYQICEDFNIFVQSYFENINLSE